MFTPPYFAITATDALVYLGDDLDTALTMTRQTAIDKQQTVTLEDLEDEVVATYEANDVTYDDDDYQEDDYDWYCWYEDELERQRLRPACERCGEKHPDMADDDDYCPDCQDDIDAGIRHWRVTSNGYVPVYYPRGW